MRGELDLAELWEHTVQTTGQQRILNIPFFLPIVVEIVIFSLATPERSISSLHRAFSLSA